MYKNAKLGERRVHGILQETEHKTQRQKNGKRGKLRQKNEKARYFYQKREAEEKFFAFHQRHRLKIRRMCGIIQGNNYEKRI